MTIDTHDETKSNFFFMIRNIVKFNILGMAACNKVFIKYYLTLYQFIPPGDNSTVTHVTLTISIRLWFWNNFVYRLTVRSDINQFHFKLIKKQQYIF